MLDILDQLDPLLRIFWYVAIPTSIIFIIQTIMTFLGGDMNDGLEADFDGNLEDHGPFQLFSLRNLINFLLGFSWSGISFYAIIPNKSILIIVSFLIGILFVAIFFFVIQQILKLSEDNTFKLEDTIGKVAEIYLPIPANRSGIGKVLITYNGSTRELDAMTEGKRIETKALVRIIKTENNQLLIVEKI